MRHNGWILVTYELTGSLLFFAISFVFNLPKEYYIAAPIIGVPLGSAIDLIGSVTITKVLKHIKMGFDTNKIRNDVDEDKKNGLLQILNLNRSFFLIDIFLLVMSFKLTGTYFLVTVITAPLLIVVFSIQIMRFEFYLKSVLYPKVGQPI